MFKKLNIYRILVSLLLITGLVIGIGAPTLAVEKVTVQTPAIPAALPLLWMQEEGVLDGFADLEVKISPDHSRALALIADNEIDMMVTGVNVGARAYNRGIDVRLLNVNTWAVDYLLTNGFEVEDWSELEGKSLSLPLQGGPLDFLARYLMQGNGVNPEDVDMIYRPLPGGARYFTAGKVDTIMLPEPLVTVTLMNNEQAVLALDIQEEWGKLHDGEERIPFVGLFGSGTLVEDNPTLVRMINGMYMKGIDWVNENPVLAAELGAKYFEMPVPVLKKSFSRVNLNYYSRSESRDLTADFLQEMLEMFPEMVGGSLPDEEFYF